MNHCHIFASEIHRHIKRIFRGNSNNQHKNHNFSHQANACFLDILFLLQNKYSLSFDIRTMLFFSKNFWIKSFFIFDVFCIPSFSEVLSTKFSLQNWHLVAESLISLAQNGHFFVFFIFSSFFHFSVFIFKNSQQYWHLIAFSLISLAQKGHSLYHFFMEILRINKKTTDITESPN